MDDLQALRGLAGTPVVLALVQLLKGVVPDTRWHPLLALAGGIGWNLALAAVYAQPLGPAALLGVIVGLVAAGVYSGGRAVVRR